MTKEDDKRINRFNLENPKNLVKIVVQTISSANEPLKE